MITLTLLSTALAAPVTYELQPEQSWLYVNVYNDGSGLASRLGHDHAVKATDFDGTVVWDVHDAASCDVRIDLPVTALRPDTPGLRERAGLDPDGAVSAGNLETIRENFLSKGQLFADQFPTITFRSTRCSGTTGAVEVEGALTIRGVAKPVAVTMTVDATEQAFSASGRFSLTHSDFGFGPYKALAGALRNQDRLDFVVDVTGQRR